MAAPEFDTYNVLPKFAEHQTNETLVGLTSLLKRTERCILWDVSRHPGAATKNLDALLALRAGVQQSMPETAHASNVPNQDSSQQELEAFYKQTLAAAGYALD